MNSQSNLIKKNKLFLNLLKNFRNPETTYISTNSYSQSFLIPFGVFTRNYISLLSIIYVFEVLNFCAHKEHHLNNAGKKKIIYFYSNLTSLKKETTEGRRFNYFQTYTINNLIIFSQPKRQLFLTFFKNKPVFIFTSGLMRMVMNEKRKSGKKLYKVAVSLIKLAVIILAQKKYFDSCFLKLNSLGQIRSKILNTFRASSVRRVISYVVFNVYKDMNAQKFSTRRSIKKYVKKRFKLNT